MHLIFLSKWCHIQAWLVSVVASWYQRCRARITRIRNRLTRMQACCALVMQATLQQCGACTISIAADGVPFTEHARRRHAHTAVHSELAVWTTNTRTDRSTQQQLSLANGMMSKCGAGCHLLRWRRRRRWRTLLLLAGGCMRTHQRQWTTGYTVHGCPDCSCSCSKMKMADLISQADIGNVCHHFPCL